jgi:chromosome segregation ATPase
MTAGLEQMLLTNAVTAGCTLAATWAAWRGKRVDADTDERVAELHSEPSFAGELRQALTEIGRLQSTLAEERGKVQLLRFELASVTADRDNLAGEVEHLRHALEDSTTRLDALNAQLTSLADVVGGLIPKQPGPVDNREPTP